MQLQAEDLVYKEQFGQGKGGARMAKQWLWK